jgi:hypothetical protein
MALLFAIDVVVYVKLKDLLVNLNALPKSSHDIRTTGSAPNLQSIAKGNYLWLTCDTKSAQ